MLFSDLFPLGYPLLSRVFLDEPGEWPLVAPPDTVWVRAFCSPAGGFKDNMVGGGGGGAFAGAWEGCVAGAAFTAQVGTSEHCRSGRNTPLGDSWVRRGDASILVYADRGRPDGTRGLAANSIGLLKLDGVNGTANSGGASAGDDDSLFPLGFGGRGATAYVSAWYGAGNYTSSNPNYSQPPGYGRVCVEFWSTDPEYDT